MEKFKIKKNKTKSIYELCLNKYNKVKLKRKNEIRAFYLFILSLYYDYDY